MSMSIQTPLQSTGAISGPSDAAPALETPSTRRSFLPGLVGFSLSLWFILAAARAYLVGFIIESFQDPFNEVPKMVMAAVYDAALIGSIAFVFALLLKMVARSRVSSWTVYAIFHLVALFVMFAGLANIQVVDMIGRPFNYPWLYYSDFLRSADAKQAVAAAMTIDVLKIALIAITVYIVLGEIFKYAIRLLGRWISGKTALLMFAPVFGIYLFISHWYLITEGWEWEKVANPVTSFVQSVIDSGQSSALLTMETPIGPDDFLTVSERGQMALPPVPGAEDSGVRDVILFVMESTPTEYLGVYGCKYPVTPEIDHYENRAMIYESIYAHAPATNQSMASLLCSVYPGATFHSLTWEHPDAAISSLTGELKRTGYHTAFIGAGDLEYQTADLFLEHRGYDFIEDYHDRGNEHAFESEWWYLSGSSEAQTVGSLINWIDQQGDAPYFATYWSMQTHYPYFAGGDETDYGTTDPSFNTYLNALRQTDEAFGQLMKHLEETGRLDRTLVIVVGDHGEAFGRHDQTSHGTRIYQENLVVPMMLINPKLFSGQRDASVGGMIDVAPTILHLLNLPQPSDWQGRSMMAADRTHRTYFCAPWNDFLFGCREGSLKFIFNASTGDNEVYDLSTDPHEENNIAADHEDFIAESQQRLAAWVQYQEKMYKNIFSKSPAATPTTQP